MSKMGEPLEPLFQEEKDLSEAKVRKRQRGGREGGRVEKVSNYSLWF